METLTQNQQDTLTPQQWAALTALAHGDSHQKAAKAAHVTPVTVAKWAKEDATFRAHYVYMMQTMRETAMRRIESIVQNAVAVVADSVAKGNVKTSLAILRATGILAGDPEVYKRMVGSERVGLLDLLEELRDES
jgi:hypothetical protein